ncbi:MAG: hypothetical protein IPI58_02050 [Alphaproteobacteria bacterium]|nr:MAG: hypothetical protein IPI58_02050 [Alphaproteobacteria bacterium]
MWGLDGFLQQKTHSQETSLAVGEASLPKEISLTTIEAREAFLPAGLTGGCCPYVDGEAEVIAWHAAAEACDSERLHLVWTVYESHVWYLAVPSADLSSHPDSWCPLVAFLPGMPQASEGAGTYIYGDVETSALMALSSNSLTIHRGTPAVLKAKAEKVSRELGGVPLVELTEERLLQLRPVAWKSLSLIEDTSRRWLTRMAIFCGLGVATVALGISLLAGSALLFSQRELAETKENTRKLSQELLLNAHNAAINPLRNQVADFVDLNQSLVNLGSWLKRYEIKAGKLRWVAMVPLSVTADRIRAIGGYVLEITPEGAIVGNQGEVEAREKERQGSKS